MRMSKYTFNQRFGPGNDTDQIKKLFEETITHIKKKRDTTLEKLRTHLTKTEVFNKSKLLNENGESIIKKN